MYKLSISDLPRTHLSASRRWSFLRLRHTIRHILGCLKIIESQFLIFLLQSHPLIVHPLNLSFVHFLVLDFTAFSYVVILFGNFSFRAVLRQHYWETQSVPLSRSKRLHLALTEAFNSPESVHTRFTLDFSLALKVSVKHGASL